MRGRAVAAMLAVLAGCSPAAAPAEDAPSPLIPSLDVTVEGDSVHMVLHVMSVLDTPVVLEFPTSQRADFWVRGAAGDTVWMWSAARSFAQVVGSEALEPIGRRSYEGSWSPAAPGEYEAVARLVSTSHPVEITVPFEVR